MKKNIKLFVVLTAVLLLSGCSSKLYTYNDVVNQSYKRIADDLVIEDPGYFNRNNGLKAYTAYLKRDEDKKITIINGKDTLFPFGQNYLCSDFSEVYLVSKFDEFKSKSRYDFNTLYDIRVEAINSGRHPKCKNLRFTINCNDKEKDLDIIDKYTEFLNEEGIYLNKNGLNRYEIFCQNGQQYYNDRNY